jgi:hypothetical protein
MLLSLSFLVAPLTIALSRYCRPQINAHIQNARFWGMSVQCFVNNEKEPLKWAKQEIFVGEFIHYCTVQTCTGGAYLQINELHINQLI